MANNPRGWFSQSRGGNNSNPNLSNCLHSSHYTADLIQTFVVAKVKAKFRTAPRSKRQRRRRRRRQSSCAFPCTLVCVFPRMEIYCARRILRRFSAKCMFTTPRAGSSRAKTERQRENYVAKLPIP